MHYCYINYSQSIDRFYIGETCDITLRLHQHTNSFFKGSYTIQANDWNVFLLIECIDKTQARKLESFIKKMKSKTFIKKLKESPDIIAALLDNYK